MSSVREEIEQHSQEDFKPVLRWLFARYHRQSEWKFVATFKEERYGRRSYEVHHIWEPTKEGLAIFLQLSPEDA